MSDDFFSDEYDDFDQEQDQAPRGNGLRQFAESQKKRADELEQRLRELEATAKKATLADTLKKAGVANPDALGKYAEVINPDEAGDFLAAVKAAMGMADEQAPPAVSEEEAAAVAAVSGDPGGSAPTAPTGDATAALAGIDNEADFWAAIRGAQ
jgi:hypothetical protein